MVNTHAHALQMHTRAFADTAGETANRPRLYFHRAFGGHRYYCHTRRDALACTGEGQGTRADGEVSEQPPRDRPCRAMLYEGQQQPIPGRAEERELDALSLRRQIPSLSGE